MSCFSPASRAERGKWTPWWPARFSNTAQRQQRELHVSISAAPHKDGARLLDSATLSKGSAPSPQCTENMHCCHIRYTWLSCPKRVLYNSKCAVCVFRHHLSPPPPWGLRTLVVGTLMSTQQTLQHQTLSYTCTHGDKEKPGLLFSTQKTQNPAHYLKVIAVFW